MEQDSDRIDTIETIPTKETVNQDGIKEEDNTKSLSSNKGNNDVIEVKSNGILNEKEINSNNKDDFCEVTLDEVNNIYICNVFCAVIRKFKANTISRQIISCYFR